MGVHFLVAGCVNLCIVLVRPFNPDNSRLCGRTYSIPALRILGLRLRAELGDLAASQQSSSDCAIHR